MQFVIYLNYIAIAIIAILIRTTTTEAYHRNTIDEGWGVPNGSRGNIDFRYPDYIVDPLLDCPTNRSYVHPRNCSWFYRCQVHNNWDNVLQKFGLPIFYIRTYYECAPGTVFSDSLQVCVAGNPKDCPPGKIGRGCINCLDCTDVDVCPGIVGKDCTMKIVPERCRGCPLEDCPADYSFSTKLGVCIPSHGSDTCENECTFPSPPMMIQNGNECIKRSKCIHGVSVTLETLCKKYKECKKFNNKIGTYVEVECPYGKHFSPKQEKCIAVPKEETAEGCEVDLGYKVTCSEENEFPESEYLSFSCSERQLCNTNIELCEKYIKCEKKGRSFTAIEKSCLTRDEEFSHSYKTCVAVKEPDACRILDGPYYAPPVAALRTGPGHFMAHPEPPAEVSVKPVTVSLECTADDLRPTHPFLKENFCTQENVCGINMNLCTEYVQCSPSYANTYDVEIMHCDTGELFSYQYDRCVSTTETNCSQFF